MLDPKELLLLIMEYLRESRFPKALKALQNECKDFIGTKTLSPNHKPLQMILTDYLQMRQEREYKRRLTSNLTTLGFDTTTRTLLTKMGDLLDDYQNLKMEALCNSQLANKSEEKVKKNTLKRSANGQAAKVVQEKKRKADKENCKQNDMTNVSATPLVAQASTITTQPLPTELLNVEIKLKKPSPKPPVLQLNQVTVLDSTLNNVSHDFIIPDDLFQFKFESVSDTKTVSLSPLKTTPLLELSSPNQITTIADDSTWARNELISPKHNNSQNIPRSLKSLYANGANQPPTTPLVQSTLKAMIKDLKK